MNKFKRNWVRSSSWNSSCRRCTNNYDVIYY